MSVVDEHRVLVLNANWTPIDECTVRHAIGMLASDAATALDTSDGCFTPVKWEDWVNLPVRESDDVLRTVKSAIRIPRTIIAVNYRAVVAKRPRLTMQKLFERDGGRCAYTNKPLSREEASMEHVVPRSKGGRTEWTNIVLADKDVNSKRGNKPLSEAGLKLLRKPFEPKPVLKAEHIPVRYPEWETFLGKKKAKAKI